MRLLPMLLLVFVLPGALAQDAPDTLRAAIQAHLEARGEKEVPPFRYALADLDGDKRDDAVVLLVGRFWCGTGGCTMLIFHATDAGYSFVSDSSATSEPIRVATDTSNGWRDLIVDTKDSSEVLLQFDGSRYPPDPWSQPQANSAQLAAARIVLGD
jgi:hypothetical protein